MAEENYGTELTFDAADEYRPEPPPVPEIPAWKDGSIRIGIHTSIAGDIAGALDIALDDMFKPNGLCFSPDYKLLYVADSGASQA